MAINTHQADHVEYIQDSNGNKHYLNAEYLDGHSYGEISNAIGGKGTVTSVATADGITGGPITTSGTIKANLKSYTKNTAEIGGRLYGVELDKNGKLAVNVPWTDTNTDTKVTSAANHYTPAADSSAQLSVDASSTTAATWNSTSLVTGVNLQRDAKGHVTGVSVDSIKMPANPNTDTHYTNYLQIKGNGTEAVKFTQDADKTLNLKPGNNVSISAASGEITINATNTHNSHIVYSGKKSDGTTDISSGTASSGNITLGDSGVTAGAYGDTAAQTPSYNATFKVPSISVNAKGIVTAVGEHTVKIPDNSNLVPYTGASKDVNLGNHSLSISDKTNASGTMIKVSGKGLSEDDIWTTIEPCGINMASPGIIYAYLGSYALTVSDGAQSGSVTETGFKATTPEGTSVYGYDGITHNSNKLSFPEKAGTIALTSDLDEKQNSSAFLSFISDTDISDNKTGFLRVYMKPIEAPGTTHYTRVAELQDLPLASSSEYGMVKLGSDDQQSAVANSVSSTMYRTYAIQKDSNGNLVVNVPWIAPQDASESTVGGVKAHFGAAIGGEGNFELYADIQQGNNTLYIRAGQFKQTSGSSSSTTRFTFKRAMNTMGGSAGYVAVILGDSYGQTTNGQWMGSLAVDGSDYAGFKYRASNSEKGHVYYIGIGRW